MYRLKSTQEIETVLNNWLNGGSAEPTQEGGSTRGAEPTDELDNLVAEVKSSGGSEKKPAAVKKTEKTESKKQSLDDAFADLIGEE